MLSNVSRYENTEQDIWQHTVNNDDYPDCWVFEDERFYLKMAIIDKNLKFLCELFHSVVKNEKRLLERVFDRNQYGIILENIFF